MPSKAANQNTKSPKKKRTHLPKALLDIATANPETAITEQQSAEIIGVATITLTQWRHDGKAPRHFKAGSRAIRYRLGDVIAYRDARMVGKVAS